MAIGQALLIKPPKPKTTLQQRQGQEIQKAAVFQEQSLKFEQSLELVQTLLGASIGCLSFLRGLLPEECFVEKRYGGKSSAAISYHSFTSDLEDESFKKTQSNSGTRVKRLRRGYSGEADQLLDWLEIGIFDALKMGYLKAVQLAIYVDKEYPDIIVESYTFSFSYRDQGDGTSTVSLRVTDITGRGVTVEDANKNLQLMMRRLIVITQNLPPLPDQRWLTIRLHYLDHTPSNYDPPSFVRVSEKSPALKFHESEAKEVEKLDVGGLNAGFHAVSLKISSMNDTDIQERPRRRRGSRFVHADVDIEAPQFTTDTSKPFARTQATSMKESSLRPTTNERVNTEEFTKPADSHSLRNPTINEGTSVTSHQITEATRRDIQEKMFLRGMLRQATRENDVIATQPLSLAISRTTFDDRQLTSPRDGLFLTPIPNSQVPGNSPTTDLIGLSLASEFMPTQTKPLQQQAPSSPKRVPLGKVSDTDIPQRQSPRNKNAGNQEVTTTLQNHLARAENAIESVDKNMAKLKLSKAKTTELKKISRSGNNNRKDRTIDNRIVDRGPEDHINCECGDEKYEEDIVCCDNCDEWQHTDCYGFTSAKDIRIPDYHVCYSCLLGKNEGKLLEEMRNMALFRRALKTIRNQGTFPSSNKIFANKLGCDLPTALQITRRLENEGFILNDAIKAKIHKKKVYKVVKTDEIRQLMDREYFDPLKKISHHFENPTAPNVIRESLLEETPPLAIPPPNTVPASPTNTMAENSQLGEFAHAAKDANLLSQLKTYTQIPNADADSTADEEDELPAQRTSQNSTISREPAMHRFKSSNRSNPTSLIRNNPRAMQEPLFEIAESPEPMEIDIVEESQVLGNLLIQTADETLGQPRMNIGWVLQDIFVGEELGDRRL